MFRDPENTLLISSPGISCGSIPFVFLAILISSAEILCGSISKPIFLYTYWSAHQTFLWLNILVSNNTDQPMIKNMAQYLHILISSSEILWVSLSLCALAILISSTEILCGSISTPLLLASRKSGLQYLYTLYSTQQKSSVVEEVHCPEFLISLDRDTLSTAQ